MLRCVVIDDFTRLTWTGYRTLRAGQHRDAEPDLEPGAPIFSYSFLSDPGAPRVFDIHTRGAQQPIASVALGHR